MVTLMAHERIVPLQNICAFAGVTKTIVSRGDWLGKPANFIGACLKFAGFPNQSPLLTMRKLRPTKTKT